MDGAKTKLAELICSATYIGLREVGNELFTMSQSEDGRQIWDLTQQHQWSEMLAEWAMAVVEENK